MNFLFLSLLQDLTLIREKKPLVHNITNYVVMNNTANALLALGASPVMAHAEDEVADMVSLASAVVINIGTLDKHWVPAMLLAGKTAHDLGKPLILDPVGAGATPYRTNVCKEIIQTCHPTIIRGNASEIMSLLDESLQTKGVDSLSTSQEALALGKQLSYTTNATISISGATDYIICKDQQDSVPYGHPMMTKVTGLGCTASALTGAFASVNKNSFEAARNAMITMGIVGQEAQKTAHGPGSLQINFLDTLYSLDENILNRYLND